MKIAFICAGVVPVPPPGWGAVEILTWEYSQHLKEMGVEVDIYNSTDLQAVINQIKSKNYDFVHLQHEDHLPYLEELKNNKFAVTNHCGWADNIQFFDTYYWRTINSMLKGDHYIFALSEKIANNFIKLGFSKEKILITKNGVAFDKYNRTNNPRFKDRTLFLGNIQFRKRQHTVSKLNLNIDFAGEGPELELSDSNRYIGKWSKENVYNKTTEYANLILPSISEAHALVCLEALASGLGIVITENCSSHLDLRKKFITILSEDDLKNEKILKEKIENNKQYSLKNREEIVEYARSFDWKKVTSDYKKIIEGLIR